MKSAQELGLIDNKPPTALLDADASRGIAWPVRLLMWIVLAAALAVVATVPLDLWSQTGFAVSVFTICWLLNLMRNSRLVTITLAVVSSVVSLRYLTWRVSSTLEGEGGSDLALGLVLLSAEAFAVAVLVLGYVQTIWPLRRRALALPEDVSTWPTIDVMIPTYNEPLSVVRTTILAALALDYPRDKMRIWVLDDGRRDEFKRFCAGVGAGYLTRSDNKHAKAGNINRALEHTRGDLIAIFDCDHIPTASFLKMTAGWFMADKKLALVQTPHHFYSPDPFERNLDTFRKVPNEGELFYGPIQQGNDLWDASFFCGSCAVIRRAPLEEIGGIAPETVTEDAHTMLKLHRRGYRSAFLDVPQAAGLATESLSSHVGQRIRWARGLAQIFRIDNPMFGRGLSLAQRLCYTSAMLHFFYGIPRIIFLTAPLFHLFLNAHIFNASAAMIMAYALPHMAHAYLTNSRVQKRHRHSFWAEVYEATLATYIAYPTTLALISPKLGKFNVTAKGGVVAEDYFDARIAMPHIIMLLLNLAGITVGVWRLTHGDLEADAVALNVAWTGYNTLILCAALGVAWERRQRRATVRVNARLPAMLRTADQRAFACHTVDLSVSGVRIAMPVDLPLKRGDVVEVAMRLDRDVVPSEAVVVWRKDNQYGLAFRGLGIEAEASLVRAIFSRPDAWTDWATARVADHPIRSLLRVLGFGVRGLIRVPAMAFARGRNGILLAGLGLLGLIASGHEVAAQVPPEDVASPPADVDSAAPDEALDATLPFGPDAGLDAGPQVTPDSGPDAQPGDRADVAPPDPATGTVTPQTSGKQDEEVVDSLLESVPPGWTARSLEGLGFSNGVRRYNRWTSVRLPFFARGDEVFTGARVELELDPSAVVPAGVRALAVTVNDEPIGEVPLDALAAEPLRLEVAPQLLAEQNTIGLSLVLAADAPCSVLVDVGAWRFLKGGRVLTRTAALPLPDALEMLPLPFFDPFADAVTPINLVLPATPLPQHVQIGAVIAGYFAARAGSRFTFPTHLGALPTDHAVLIVTADDPMLVPDLGPISGPMIAIRDNPNGRERQSKLLILAGRTLDEALVAARKLAFDYEATRGSRDGTLLVTTAPRVQARVPYDAPRWQHLDEPLTFGAIADEKRRTLRSAIGGTISIDFRIPPDVFVWPRNEVKLHLRWREDIPVGIAPPKLALEINGHYLHEFTTGQVRGRSVEREEVVSLPVGELRGYNQLLLHVVPEANGYCPNPDSDIFEVEIRAESSLALDGHPRFKEMPDVSSFVDDGYPFTRLADLSQTLLLLPAAPLPEEIASALSFTAHTAAVTGHPASGLTVLFGGQPPEASGRDVLVIGVASRLPLLATWDQLLPLEGFGRRAPTPQALPLSERLVAFLRGDPLAEERERLAGDLRPGRARSYVLGLESPNEPGRSIVVVTAENAATLPSIPDLRGFSRAREPHADVLVRLPDARHSYRVTSGYGVGTLPWWTKLRWLLARYWMLLVPGLLMVAFAFAWMMRRRLARLEWERLSLRDNS